MNQAKPEKSRYQPKHRRRPSCALAGASQYTNGFYHLCVKTCRARPAFKDEADYIVFLALLKQFLRLQRLMTQIHYNYIIDDPKAVKLFAYKLSPIGCQLLLNTSTDSASISKLAHSVLVAYEAYFCRKYNSRNKLFNHNFKMTKIADDSTVVAMSQSLNQEKLGWQRSSRDYYVGKDSVDWVHSHNIINMSGNRANYKRELATLN